MPVRTLARVIESMATSDGAGVRLRRSLGSVPGLRLDPFLMLDEFGTDNPDDYIAGFPPHPHRGFETVTYMIDGHMRHEDHLGHMGDLKSGGVQWMTAGRGIIHSEMPQQTEGRMRGFQLWINLPAREKMKPASYRDIRAEEIPTAELPGGGSAKIIAGILRLPNTTLAGPVSGLATDPLFVDVDLPGGQRFTHPVNENYNAFVYAYDGSLEVGPDGARRPLPHQAAGVLSSGDVVEVAAATMPTRFIVLAGRPLNEPIAQYGPFVMNTPAEIEQAIRDYQTGRLTSRS